MEKERTKVTTTSTCAGTIMTESNHVGSDDQETAKERNRRWSYILKSKYKHLPPFPSTSTTIYTSTGWNTST